jgi:predicted dehydrogenase
MKVLVVGLGGIGQRHTRNLRALYGDRCDIIAYRVRGGGPVLSDNLQVDYPSGLEERYGIRSFHDLDAALAERPLAVLICNPTSLHLPVALAAARAGCHLMVEKPISDSLVGLDELAALVAERSLVCMVAYQLRFHPCMTLAHRLFCEGVIGRAIACRAAVGEYLPGWHHYEDYRTMYASRRALGGGVVLSQIHEIDLLYWFFGRPERAMSMGGHLSNLEIDVEDVASTLFSYPGMVAHLHQDYLQQPAVRQMEIIGSSGKIAVNLRENSVQVFDGSGELKIQERHERFERNSMFLQELEWFLKAADAGGSVPVDLYAGRQSLEMALAIRHSIASGMPVNMKSEPE